MKTSKKILSVLIFTISINVSVYSQNLFVENFNYPVRDSLQGIGGWMESGGGNPLYNVKIISPGLVYPGYIGSGIGNTVFFSNNQDGSVCINYFPVQTSGKIYMSFMIRVDSLSANATNGYNISFDQFGGITNLNTRLYIRKLTSSTFNFGITKTEYVTAYSPIVYLTNTTYLVVVKYTFVPGTANDSAKLYVFPSGIPASEPVTPSAFTNQGIDIPDIGEIVLSNSYAQTGLQKSSLKIDGIRVGKTWSNTLLTNVYKRLDMTALVQGFYNNILNKMVKDTARVYLRYNFPPYSLVDSSKSVLDSAGRGIFLFNKISKYTPYYIIVRHRNSIETWSGFGLQFSSDSLNYNFTTGDYQAYGENLILKGSKYCIYNGDINQDGNIDLTDIISIHNNSSNFLTGYKVTDVNGDNITDLNDNLIAYNNSVDFVSREGP